MDEDREIQYTQLFIDNEFVDALGGKTFAVINPATAEKSCDVQEGEAEDIDVAVAAARQAFELGSQWRTMDASARGILLHKLANLVERDMMQIAYLISICNGKVYKEALQEMHMSMSSIRYYAGWADKIHGKTIPADGQHFSYTRMEPVGVVGFVTPWNFPFYLTVVKLSAALACGCTVVHKPAEQTPLDALHLASLFKEAEFPPGVYNVVPGFGPSCGQPLAAHMNVDKVSFTGSTEIGQLIQSVAGQSNSKRVTLETGGKSPLVICADADIDEAVEMGHQGLFYLQGQVCAASSRIYVHEDIYDEFVEKSKVLAMARIVGNPFDSETTQGPQVDKAQYEKVIELLEAGKAEGAILECGGDPTGEPGYFIQPTVFSGVEDHMRIAKEEIFGPVQQILKFKTINEVIARANDTPYGLASGIVTNNLKTMLMFAQGVRAGSVWVNCYMALKAQTPFGGFKMSGFGREGGYEGLLAYMDVKTVTIKIPQKNS